MSFVTYAQNFEDLVLWRALRNVKNGFYIDIGAYDPVEYSVTKAFYDQGWRGINIEPSPEHFARLAEQRPNDINVQAVVGDRVGESEFYHFRDTGLSTVSEQDKQTIMEAGFPEPSRIAVRMTTVDEICRQHQVEIVHFLKIDVEGAEDLVLRGASFDRVRPWIVVIECTAPFSNVDVSSEWEDLIVRKGYEVCYFDGLNKFYVASEHAELKAAFQLPPNVIDDYVSAEHLSLQNEAALARNERDSALRGRRDAEQKAKVLSAELDRHVAEVQALRANLAASQALIDAMHASTSWRITAPVRALKSFRYNWASEAERGLKSGLAKSLRLVRPLVANNAHVKRLAMAVLDRAPIAKHRVFRVLERPPLQSRRAPPAVANRPSGVVETASGSAANPFRDNERVVLLYVEHTASFERTTGIQRVCQKLAGMLHSAGETVVPVKLERTTLSLAPLNAEEAKSFGDRAGIQADSRFSDPATFASALHHLRHQPRVAWLIIPEVTYHTRHSTPPTSRLVKTARDLGCRVGVIFYDVIPFLVPDAAENVEKHAQYMSTIAMADVIWPISRYSTNHLLEFYSRYDGLSASEMPMIVPAPLAEEMETPRRMRLAADRGRSIVCVGTIDERKNQVTLIKAFNRFCERHPGTEWKLHLAGLIRDNYKATIEAEVAGNPNIALHFDADDQVVSDLYMNCAFTVFPSSEEGFGLPVVESLWNLKPCICADFSSMAELQKGGGCVAADTSDVDSLLAAITSLTDDDTFYESKVEEILHRPVKTWFEYASGLTRDMDRAQFGKAFEGVIYYWIDATLSASANTGIQRVNRQLARHLIDLGHRLVPVKWSDADGRVAAASTDELEYMARWNGPSLEGWYGSFDPARIEPSSAYLMAELPLNRAVEIQGQVIRFFKERKVHCAAVFYDAIPFKLAGLYPEPFTRAHVEYMNVLDAMDLILAISETSRRDLARYLAESPCRALATEVRLKTVELPAEFPERSGNSDSLVRQESGFFQILSVGTVEPRKNHETLVKAFLEAEKRSAVPLKLTIVGGEESFDKDLPGRIDALVRGSSTINWIKSASDTRLRAEFEKADLTVFPSYEEGFGIPILESLWFGVPCICSHSGQMAELAAHGGCETVDVLSTADLRDAIVRLANSPDRLAALRAEIRDRHFKTWSDYAAEVSAALRARASRLQPSDANSVGSDSYALPPRPVLSLCITTYNRSGWLALNLEHLIDVSRSVRDRIEIIVCDNHSTDETPAVAARFAQTGAIQYHRNSGNIGMLGNLPQTVSLARGEYVWLIGDDDLVHRDALETILRIIEEDRPDLINLNYAYARDPEPPAPDKLEAYFAQATLIAKGGPTHAGPVETISGFNENFYTAIYTFIVKNKHAQRIFTQDTSGAPFSSLQTCVPSSKYILSYMMGLKGYWINEPLITINMNVSWGKYAPLWVLERLPEVYDLAELNGVPQAQADRWRAHTLQMVPTFFEMVFASADEPSVASFDVESFVRRWRHVKEFRDMRTMLISVYDAALARHHPLARISLERFKAVMQ